jgi:hypothetical protein
VITLIEVIIQIAAAVGAYEKARKDIFYAVSRYALAGVPYRANA